MLSSNQRRPPSGASHRQPQQKIQKKSSDIEMQSLIGGNSRNNINGIIMDEKYQKSTNTNNSSTNMFRFHKSPIFANIDFDKLNLRKRDKKDASAKKFRVRVPFRIVLWFILIFLMVPLGIGFHILIVKLSNRATGGGVGGGVSNNIHNPTTVHLKREEENPSSILTTAVEEGGDQQEVLEEPIIGNDSQLMDAGTIVGGVGDRSESQIINVVEKPPVDEISTQDEKIIIGQTIISTSEIKNKAPQQQQEEVIEPQQQQKSMNTIPQQQQQPVSEVTTNKNNVVTETVQNQTISRLDT